METYQGCVLKVSILDRHKHCTGKIRCPESQRHVPRLQSADTQQHQIFIQECGKSGNSEKSHHSAYQEASLDARTSGPCKMRVSCLMDPMLASCLTTEIQRSVCFRKAFMILLERHCRRRCCRRRCEDATTDTIMPFTNHWNFKVFLQLTDLKFFRLDPDIQWSERMLPWWTVRLLLEDAFSWLSTLGGAYSSLGERFSHCAIEAGRLSLRQLKLAIRLGDPLLQARCYVYLSLSLMQRGFLKQAKNIIRHQYKFAVSLGERTDARLVAMCHGVWCHLRFHHQSRRQMREARQCQDKTGREGHSSQHQNGTKNVGLNPGVLGNIVM